LTLAKRGLRRSKAPGEAKWFLSPGCFGSIAFLRDGVGQVAENERLMLLAAMAGGEP
jgi:hypothetical protein